MVLFLGTNCGFVTVAPTADPEGTAAVTIKPAPPPIGGGFFSELEHEKIKLPKPKNIIEDRFAMRTAFQQKYPGLI